MRPIIHGHFGSFPEFEQCTDLSSGKTPYCSVHDCLVGSPVAPARLSPKLLPADAQELDAVLALIYGGGVPDNTPKGALRAMARDKVRSMRRRPTEDVDEAS